MKDNAATMSAEDKTRYDAQYKIVTQIVAAFEDPSYSDEDAEKGLKIVELMQEVCFCTLTRPHPRRASPHPTAYLTYVSTDARTRLATVRDHGPAAARVRPWS